MFIFCFYLFGFLLLLMIDLFLLRGIYMDYFMWLVFFIGFCLGYIGGMISWPKYF